MPISRQVASYTTENLCARIFDRHASRIKVKKRHVAIGNLERIVDAFLKLATKKGFHETSLRDLTGQSGLSMGGLYSYFDSKETLLMMVLEEVENSVVDLLSRTPEDVIEDPREHLRWIIEAHIRLTEMMQPWFAFAYLEVKAFPTKLKHAAIESELVAEDKISEVLERGVEQGYFKPTNVKMTASVIKPILQDWYVKRAKYRRRGISVDAYIAFVQDFVLRSLAA